MGDDDIEPPHIEPAHVEPSRTMRAFGVIGSLIAVSAVAAIATYVIVTVNKWDRHTYSIFGIAWGITARLFAHSVRRGIKHTLTHPYLPEQKRVMLGEQLAMLQFTRWFVRIELVGSVILLIVELMTR